MHQHELAAQPPGGERACLDGAEPRVGAAAGQQRDVALAEAEPAPFGVLGVGEVDDVVMAALDPVEPAGELVAPGVGRSSFRGLGAELPVYRVPIEQDRGAVAGELLRQRCGDRFRVRRVAPRRDDGDGAVPGVRLRPVDREQPLDEQPGHLGEETGVLLDQRLERRGAQQEQVAVAHRADRRRPHPVAQQRDLPDDRAAAEVMQHALPAACRADTDPEPAAEQHVQAVAWIALGDDRVARLRVHRLELPRQPDQGALVEGREERDASQERAQLMRTVSAAHAGSIAAVAAAGNEGNTTPSGVSSSFRTGPRDA